MSGRGSGLYDPAVEHSACGVGFITRKDGAQTHDVIVLGDQALCAIPHRGGMSAEGVGDGAGSASTYRRASSARSPGSRWNADDSASATSSCPTIAGSGGGPVC